MDDKKSKMEKAIDGITTIVIFGAGFYLLYFIVTALPHLINPAFVP